MLLIAVMGLVGNVRVCAQVDTEFWFAAPFASPNGVSNFHLPVYMRFSSYDDAATVTISQPANAAFAPITFSMPANSVNTIDLSPFINQIHNTPADQVLNRGLLITATADVSVYYEIASTFCGCSPELYSLKGRNALGTEFLLSYQTVYRNNQGYNPRPRSSFEIVASMDNTQVTITPTTNLDNHAVGVPYTVTLNRGETFAGKSVDFNSGSQPNGTVVTANNPIAITLTDDLVTPNFGGCADLMGDQTVPVAVVGEKYIVIKGGLSSGELISILATRNNTQIFLDGSGVPSATINRGQSFIHYLTAPSVYIETTEPAYVLHISGFGCELGEAILPPIECTGSNLINAVRTTPNAFAINVLATANIINAFTINGSPALIPPAAFSPVPGTGGQWVSAKLSFTTAQVPVGGVVSVANTDGFFHIGVIHDNNGASGGGCSYGYFSNFSQPVLYANDTSRFCFGDSVNLTTTSGWDSIWWINLATLDTISNDTSLNLTTSEEILLVTELSGCLYFDTITVHENDSMYFVPNVLPASCLGQDGAIDVDTVIGNWGSYTFLFNNNPAVPPFANLATGGYPITVIDSMACEASQTVTVPSGPNGLILQIDSAGQPACSFNDSTGYIAYAILNGVAPYDVYLNGNLLGNNAQALLDSLPNGNYTLLVEDANNCLATWDTVFNIAPATPIALLPDSALVCYGDTAALSIVPQSWDYVQWTDSASNTVVGTTPTFQANTSSTLWVEAALAQCIYHDTIRVTVLSQIYLTASFASVSCFGGNDGAINITNLLGTVGPSTYTLNSSPAVPPFTGLIAGGYSVTVTDSLGCEASAFAVVADGTQVILQIDSAGQPACSFNDSTGFIAYSIISGVGPYNIYLNGTLLGNNMQDLLDSLPNGNYTLLVEDANNCLATWDTVFNIAPATPIALLPDSALVCSGNTAPLSIVPQSWDYVQWTDSASNTVVGTTTSYQATASGTLWVEAGLAQCIYRDTIRVTVLPQINLTASITSVSCFGGNDGEVDLTNITGATGGIVDYFFDGNNTLPPFGNVSAGVYPVSVTDNAGCTGSIMVAVPQPDSIAINVAQAGFAACGYGTIDFNITGGALPYVVTANSVLLGNVSAATLDSLAPGNYTITVTDANGCTMQLDTALQAPAFVNRDILTPSNISLCVGENALLDAGAGWDSIFWMENGTVFNTTSTWLVDSTINIMVRTTDGTCEYWDSISVFVADSIIINPTIQPISCFGANNGALSVAVQGGNGAFAYSFNNNPIAPPYGNLGPASYNLVVIDGNGCEAEFTFALTEPAQLTILLDTVSVLNCAQTSGLIGYTTTGGTLPLTVTLDNASPLTQPQGTYTGVAIGAHTVQVTDSNGCTAAIDTAIAQLDFAAGEVVWTNVSCFGAADGTADVVVTQGTPPYQYFVNGTPTILPASNLAPGSYSLLVTDANGCSDTLTFEITEPPLFEIDLDSVITVFLGQEVTLEPTYTDEPVSFAWIPPYGLNCDNCPAPVASSDSSTLYNLTATNGNGCTAQASVWVDVLGHVIYIPNVFTPNNDLLNDEFRVYGQGFADFEFKIFDRWGELIFRTTDVYRGWDGTFKGVLMPPGTYVYTCNYRFFGGYEQLQKGSVLLLR